MLPISGIRIGLDIGGTKTEGLALSDDGAVVARTRRATKTGPGGVVETVVASVADLRTQLGVAEEIVSVGIGVPGQVHPATSVVEHALNLRIERMDLAGVVAPLLSLPVMVENDVKAAALGSFSLDGSHRDLAYLNLGTGIAAGFVINGALFHGGRGAAGEIGHVMVDPAGPRCRCGSRGCIEAFAGGAALSRRWGRPGTLPVLDIFDAADSGDSWALSLRAELARAVAAAIRIIALTVDVEVVLLGGGMTAIGERLTDAISDALAMDAASSSFVSSLELASRVEVLPPGAVPAARGAALLGARAAGDREAVTHG
ncbi:ROK family protein [Microbacterium sp. NPDC076895]|uniref:ROK family protein n=1 Tax=Microbacterium sp. NPDC076895 TaxID=3154957 RepID=UPI00341FA100